jgi:hypothetical protein
MGNYTIISASTNLGVSTEEPATYIERLNVSKDELRLQCVPEDPSLWRVLNYDKFCTERQKLLARTLNAYLGL